MQDMKTKKNIASVRMLVEAILYTVTFGSKSLNYSTNQPEAVFTIATTPKIHTISKNST